MQKDDMEVLATELDQDDECGMSDLHRALDDAMEFLAAYLSYARGNEVPPECLIDATDEAIDRVAQWRQVTRGAVMLETDAGRSRAKKYPCRHGDRSRPRQ